VVSLIVDKFMEELNNQVAERGVSIRATPAAHQWMAEHGYKPEFGAREMGRIIHSHVKRPLADLMLFGELQGGGTAIIDVEEDELTVRVDVEHPPSESAESELVDA
jgi:ATP-dependent Clp protease ATP-binding subunit ClpA